MPPVTRSGRLIALGLRKNPRAPAANAASPSDQQQKSTTQSHQFEESRGW